MKKININRVIIIFLFACLCMIPKGIFADKTEDCEGECNHVAAIGDIHYDTLQEAFNDAPADGSSATIKLLKDTTANVVINGGKKAIFDMQGHTLTGNFQIGTTKTNDTGDLTIMGEGKVTYTSNVYNDATILLYNGNLTIENGTYEKNGDSSSGEVVYSYGTSSRNNNKLIIKGGTFINNSTAGINYSLKTNCSTVIVSDAAFSCTRSGSSAAPYAIYVQNGTTKLYNVTASAVNAGKGYAVYSSSDNVTIYSGNYSAGGYAVYLVNSGNIDIKNGKYTGGTYAIYKAGTGTATICDGYFAAATYPLYCTKGTTNVSGGAFYGAGPALYATGSTTNVNISGGIFTGNPDLEVNAILAVSSAKINVSGGYFLHKDPVTSYLVDGFAITAEPVENEVSHLVGTKTYSSYYKVETLTPENATASITSGNPESTVYYNSLTAAMSAATAGDEVILLQNCSENVTLKENVTLNINNKTYSGTVSSYDAVHYANKTDNIYSNVKRDADHAVAYIDKGDDGIVYYGSLNGAITAAASGDTVVLINTLNYGSTAYGRLAQVVDKNITIDMNGHSIYGNFTSGMIGVYANSGTVKLTISDNSASKGGIIYNSATGSSGGYAIVQLGDSEVTVSDVSLYGGYAGVYQHISYGNNSLVVSAGAIVSGGSYAGVMVGQTGSVTVSGGTVSGGARGISFEYNGGVVTINSGNVIGTSWGIWNKSNKSNCTINIKGGYITGTSYYGIYINSANNTINVSGGNVAGYKYGIYLYESKANNVVNISNGAVSGGTYGICIGNVSSGTGGTVNISGGTVSSTGTAIAMFSSATLNMTGGTLQSIQDGFAVANNGSNTVATNIEISGGTLISESDGGTAIYHPGPGTMNISGDTTITGYSSGIEIRSGSLNISGGSITALAESFSSSANENGTTTSGSALVITQHTTKNNIDVNIYGGNFKGIKSVYEANIQQNEPSPTITLNILGGFFDGDVSLENVDASLSGGYYSDVFDKKELVSNYNWVNNYEINNLVYPFKVVPSITMDDYVYNTQPAIPSALITPNGTTSTVFYYSSNSFLDKNNNGIEWENITGTSLEPGNYFMKAAYYSDSIKLSESPQVTFTVTKGTQAAPSAPGTNENVVTVAEADRSEALEYAVDEESNWTAISSLSEDGSFTIGGLTAGSHTVYLRFRENALYEASSSASSELTVTQYSVSYNLNYGTGTAPLMETAMGTSVLTVAGSDNIGRTGYTFAGWNTKADGSGTLYTAGSTISGGAILYAQWTANNFVVRFNKNGGTGSLSSQNFTYDVSQVLTENTFTKTGYTFAGWALRSDGPVVYADKQLVKNITENGSITLYAVWTKNIGDVTGTISTTSSGPITLELKQGSAVLKTVDVTPTGSDPCSADVNITAVPYGTYNLVIRQGNVVVTQIIVNSEESSFGTITMPDQNVNSVLTVTEGTAPVVVGNLEKEAESKAEEEKNVFVIMTADKKEEEELPETATAEEQDTQDAIDAIKKKALEVTELITDEQVQVNYLNVTVEKYVGPTSMTLLSLDHAAVVENITKTNNVMEIILPYDMKGKENIIVYRYHDGQAAQFTKLNELPSGDYQDATYYLDTVNNLIYIYGQKFSTYGISYTTEHKEEGGSVITFNTISCNTCVNGSLSVNTGIALYGEIVTINAVPDEGYKLSILKITGSNGKDITPTKVSDSVYTFIMPDANVIVSSVFTKETACPKDSTCVYAKFSDADTKAWYHDGVHFCVECRYMIGISDTEFAPSVTLSRAMIVQILWNMEGKPVTNYPMSFNDVPEDQWYTEAVRWAQSTGIVEGYSSEVFGPNDDATREQFAVILYRYAKYKGYNTEKASDLAAFTDKDSVSSWALDSVRWANAANIVIGRTTTTIVPGGNASRAEAACMVQRFCENIAQ